jgi:hypothetical protein
MFCSENFCSHVTFLLCAKCRNLTICCAKGCLPWHVTCFCGNEILLREVCVWMLAQCSLLFFRLKEAILCCQQMAAIDVNFYTSSPSRLKASAQ